MGLMEKTWRNSWDCLKKCEGSVRIAGESVAIAGESVGKTLGLLGVALGLLGKAWRTC